VNSVSRLVSEGTAQVRRLAPLLLLVAVVGGGFVVVTALVAHANDIELYKLSSDPAEITKTPVYYGLISMVGFAVGGAGVGAALVGWLVSRRTGVGHAQGTLLGQAGLLMAVLVVDDVVEFHEDLAQDVGLAQVLVVLVYAVAALALVIANRRAIRSTEWILLLLAGFCSAASVVVDSGVFGTAGGPYVEDAFKFGAITLLTAYLVRTAVHVAIDVVPHEEHADGGPRSTPHTQRSGSSSDVGTSAMRRSD
jgi:hypothetical protein